VVISGQHVSKALVLEMKDRRHNHEEVLDTMLFALATVVGKVGRPKGKVARRHTEIAQRRANFRCVGFPGGTAVVWAGLGFWLGTAPWR
jgi:hypothetical protein